MTKTESDNRAWEVIHSEYIIDRPWLHARRDHVKLPTGAEHDEYYILEYPEWINVIAITADGMMVMERQYRHGLRRTDIEICAGVAEPGEDPLEAAKRELLEETGYAGGTWREFMTIAPNPGNMTNYSHTFIAEGVTRCSGQHLDRTEDIEVLLMSPDEVFAHLRDGAIIQALMAAPLWRYFYEIRPQEPPEQP